MNRFKYVPWPVFAFFLFWVVYFTIFWSQAITFDKAGNLLAGHVNIWGDWAAHFSMGSALGYRDLFLTESPLIAGQRFSYPYLNNWFSAILIHSGMSFWSAFVFPSFVLSIALVVILVMFYKQIFKTYKVALLSAIIFLCNGGIGWYYFIQDILTSSQPFNTLINPPHEYTRLDEKHIKWISVIDSMIIPQRAFALGFPLAVLSLFLVLRARQTLSTRTKLVLSSLAGVIIGILPIAHTHSYLAVAIILTTWAVSWILPELFKFSVTEWQPWLREVFKKHWSWMLSGVLSLVFALPIYNFFFAHQVKHFIQWYPGWLANAQEFNEPFLLFWFKNWTIVPVLAGLGWMMIAGKKQRLQRFLFFTPFFALFILINLFLFQPFAWDNTKLIVWSSLGFSGLTGYLLVQIWDKWSSTKMAVLRLGVIGLFVFVTASGMIDAYRILRIHLHQYQMYSAEEVALSEWVKKNTPTTGVWLTGNQHNHWLFNLTGRQPLMSYPGWLWTYGYNITPPMQLTSSLYLQPDQPDVWKANGITTAIIGPVELREINANKIAFDHLFPALYETENYTIYKIQFADQPEIRN